MQNTILSIAVAVAFFTSCKGPEGQTGPTGPTGPAGSQGPPGRDGGSNVTVVNFSVSSSAWVLNGFSYTYSQTGVSAITQSVYDNGAVLVYLKTIATTNSPGGTWESLPFTYAIATTYSRTYRYAWSVGQIFLDQRDSDGVPVRPSSTQLYKAIIIGSSSLEKRLGGIDLTNYKVVSQALGISN
jgi:hypothetical protein